MRTPGGFWEADSPATPAARFSAAFCPDALFSTLYPGGTLATLRYVHRIGRAGRSEGSEGHAYSFFTRNLAALAPGLVRFLARSTQKIDPFLKELAEEFTAGKLDASKLNSFKHNDYDATPEVSND